MSASDLIDVVSWAETHYVYVEKDGPFMQTAQQAWQQVHTFAAALSAHNQITGAFAMYKMDPPTYRAGFRIAAPAVKLPAGLTYVKTEAGKFARYVVKGSYSQLPVESGKAWEEFGKSGLPSRNAMAIENYANDPKTTPEDQLITEILMPIE
jgi:predicted transcriptional regulator YdeE